MAGIALLGAGATMAETAYIPCSAFAPSASGSWTVVAPVAFEFEGRLLAPTVGTTFPYGISVKGIDMSDVLHRECEGR